jgi:hypothetical protein
MLSEKQPPRGERGESGEIGEGAGGTGELEDVEAGAGAIDDVDIAAVVHFDVVGFDDGFAGLARSGGIAGGLRFGGDGGNVVADLGGMEGVSNIHGADASVEVGEEHDAAVIDGSKAFVGGMRAEAATAAAEMTAGFGNAEGGDAEGRGFLGDVEEVDHLERAAAFLGERFTGDGEEIAATAFLHFGESGNVEAEKREDGVGADVGGKIHASDLRIEKILWGGFAGAVEQLFAVEDLHDSGAARTVSDVDAIAFRSGGEGAVNFTGDGAGGAGLLTGQAEIAKEHGLFGTAEVEDLDHAAGAPLGIAGDEIGDAGVALPPAFVRVVQTADDDGEAMRTGGIGDVPEFVGGIAEGAEEIDLGFVGVGENAAVADAGHLRTTGFELSRLAGFAGNVRQIERMGRVGDVEDGGAVVFDQAGERVERGAPMVADVDDPAAALMVNRRLIGAAALEIVGTDKLHVAGFWLLLGLRGERGGERKEKCGNAEGKISHEDSLTMITIEREFSTVV